MNTDKIYAESIANEYSIKKSSKVVALRKLDRKAKVPSLIFAYSFGIISTLILGIGMCLAMEVIGNGLGMFILGIILGIIGIIGCSLNYPLFTKIRKYGMNKYASDIVTLASQIANE